MIPESKNCVYCGRANIDFMACDCKQAIKTQRQFKKKSNYRLLKSLGRCPECGAVWAADDLDKDLILNCKGCGYQETYKSIKERLAI